MASSRVTNQLRRSAKAKPMQGAAVNSSHLALVRYDGNKRQLFITFHNGSVYRYEGISQHKFDSLMNAKSAGTYFTNSIKHKHQYKKMK